MIDSAFFIPAFVVFVIVFILSAYATIINKQAPDYTKALALFTNIAGMLVGGYFFYQYYFLSPQCAYPDVHIPMCISHGVAFFRSGLYSIILNLLYLPGWIAEYCLAT